MTYAAILVAVSGAADDSAALAIAADLAQRQQAQLNVLTILPAVDAGARAYSVGVPVLGAPVTQALMEARGSLQAQMQAMAAHEADRFGLGSEGGGRWSMVEAGPSPWFSLAGRLPLSDLVVLGHSAAVGEGQWKGVLSEALMAGRAPVLVARGDLSASGRPAAVAWDGSLECGRAVRAAVPLLKEASEVLILQDPEGLEERDSVSADPRHLVAYLGHHGVGPLTMVSVRGRDEGAALRQAAQQAQVALLVSGAFGHSRLREAIFGGATRAFLRDAEGPHLFLCH